jgi:hypothetical protein
MRQLRSLTIVGATGILLWWSAARSWDPPAARPPADTPAVLAPLRDAGERYWKGNLHTHSLWSDGDDFPEMIGDWYKRNGYHFLALTDHNVLAEGSRWRRVDEKSRLDEPLRKYRGRFGERWVELRDASGGKEVRLKPLDEFRSMLEEPGRFLLIPGEEITDRFGRFPVHLNATNLRDLIKPASGDSVTAAIRANLRAVTEQQRRLSRPILVHLNHPNFHYGVRLEDFAAIEELRFFEVYNGHPDVNNRGDAAHPSCERMWDVVLALRLGRFRMPLVYGLATDDAHRYHRLAYGQANPGRGWIMVEAPYLSAEALLDAMHSGDFYSTSGVELLSVRRADRSLTIRIKPEAGVTYRTRFIATFRDALQAGSGAQSDTPTSQLVNDSSVGKVVAESDSLEPSYRFSGNELYVRATVISSKRHPNPSQTGEFETAWVQPAPPL